MHQFYIPRSINMKNSAKNILTAIPLVVGLAGSASAAMSDAAVNDQPVASGAIDSLLDQYSGLLPGEHGSNNPVSAQISQSQQLSNFTGSGAAMSGSYNGSGSERIVSGPGSQVNESFEHGGRDRQNSATEISSPPMVAAFTAVSRTQPDSLSAVSTGIAPSSTGSSPQSVIVPAGELPTTFTPPAEPIATPIPAAAILLGSGLAALAPLRRRKENELETV
jgi:hypothetical protein